MVELVRWYRFDGAVLFLNQSLLVDLNHSPVCCVDDDEVDGPKTWIDGQFWPGPVCD